MVLALGSSCDAKMKRDEASGCCGCSGKQNWLLHNIRHRGDFQRFCTSCVLKLHPGLFCASCFDVFDGSPPSDAVRCSKCPSVSHSSCLGSDDPSRFLCTTCNSPNVSFFKPKVSDKSAQISESEAENSSRCRVIDLTSAKILVAATRIAFQSVSRAAAAARAEADRKVREAALARRRARDALERAVCAVNERETNAGAVTSSTAAQQKSKPLENGAAAVGAALPHPIERLNTGDWNGASSDGGTNLVQKLSKDGKLKRALLPSSGNRLFQNNLAKNVKKRSLVESTSEHKKKLKSLSDPGMNPRSILNQGQAVANGGAGVMFAGTQNTPALLS